MINPQKYRRKVGEVFKLTRSQQFCQTETLGYFYSPEEAEYYKDRANRRTGDWHYWITPVEISELYVPDHRPWHDAEPGELWVVTVPPFWEKDVKAGKVHKELATVEEGTRWNLHEPRFVMRNQTHSIFDQEIIKAVKVVDP